MERLNLLSVALGLACLAGLNLYLTVFATGLAIHFHWIVLAPQYQSLSILGHSIVITISGVLFLLEFFADKIPWIDSIWDAVHTIIRPIGGALLALQVLGHSTPMLDVVIVLLAGTTRWQLTRRRPQPGFSPTRRQSPFEYCAQRRRGRRRRRWARFVALSPGHCTLDFPDRALERSSLLERFCARPG